MRWDKHQTMSRCAEEYYGKAAILATWEEFDGRVDLDYLRGLRNRVRTARQRIVYATRNTPMRAEKAAHSLEDEE